MESQQVTLVAYTVHTLPVRSCVFDALLKIVFSVVDGFLRFFGIKQLTEAASKHALYLLSVLGYMYLLKKNEGMFRDDITVGLVLLLASSSTLGLSWRCYKAQVACVACRFYRQVKLYGRLRVFIYVLSVVLAAFLFVAIADVFTTKVSSTVSEEVVGRLEDNIIDIEEDRTAFGEVTMHPITKGKKDPGLLIKLFRYPQEDVQMECEFKTPWLPGASPANDQVVWRRNGVPLTFSDRYSHQLSVREDLEGKTVASKLYKAFGFSEYEVNSTLTIYLLRESEFGSYTCHSAWYMNSTLKDFIEKVARLPKSKNNTANAKDKQSVRKKRAPQHKTKNPLDKKHFFQDEFTQKGEYRLIKMRKRQEIIRASASSILHFTTSYWHLSWKDEVEVDYSVNKQSYDQLCPDGYFHGCSKFLALYWYFGHKIGGRFGIPPLQLFTIWKNPSLPAERYSLVHCLCENAYGYHNVKYLRRYYNSTSKQHELIEILHPNTLVVVPREQKMLHLFVNRSQCSPVIEPPICDKPPAVCKPGWDFQTVQEFAEAAVFYFHWIEIFVMTAALVLVVLVFRWNNLFLAVLGRYIRRFTLEGSMGFSATATLTRTLPTNSQLAHRKQTKEEDVCYGVYLSYSEAEADMTRVHNDVLPYLESRGLKVCVRERDIPPNLQELHGISKAIENSAKFVVFLSKAYFEDNFRKVFEAAMLVEAACGRPEGSAALLLVKLDHCKVPPWLTHLKVHDWTATCLSLHDHLLRLLKWLEPQEHRGTVRSKVDAFLMILPLLALSFLGWFVWKSDCTQLYA